MRGVSFEIQLREGAFFAFVVGVGLVDESVEGFIDVSVFDIFPALLDDADELLGDDVVDAHGEDGRGFLGLLQFVGPLVQLEVQVLDLFAAPAVLLHQGFLPVDQLQFLLQTLVVVFFFLLDDRPQDEGVEGCGEVAEVDQLQEFARAFDASVFGDFLHGEG